MSNYEEAYLVTAYRQVLYDGTWDDGDWDWEYIPKQFDDRQKATEYFKNYELSLDIPFVRLEKILIDRYGCIDAEYLIDERNL